MPKETEDISRETGRAASKLEPHLEFRVGSYYSVPFFMADRSLRSLATVAIFRDSGSS